MRSGRRESQRENEIVIGRNPGKLDGGSHRCGGNDGR